MPAAAYKHRPGGNAAALQVGQQFALQARRDAQRRRAAAQAQHAPALAHQLGRDLGQALQRQAGDGKQLDQQVKPVIALMAGGAQQAQVLGAGQFRRCAWRRGLVPHHQVMPPAPAQIPVDRRNAHVDGARLVPLPLQMPLPGG